MYLAEGRFPELRRARKKSKLALARTGAQVGRPDISHLPSFLSRFPTSINTAGSQPSSRAKLAPKELSTSSSSSPEKVERRKSALTTSDVHHGLQSDMALTHLDERGSQVGRSSSSVPIQTNMEERSQKRAERTFSPHVRPPTPSQLTSPLLPPFPSALVLLLWTHQVTSTKAGPKSLILSIRSYRFWSP